jgi:predicted dienelactone hydrolase
MLLVSLMVPLNACLADSEVSSQRSGAQRANADNVVYEDWQDTTRNRTVPVKIYLPQEDGKKHPVIIFSHGLGGSRDGAVYLGKQWSSHGYLCIFVQHPGSDSSVWQDQRGQGQARIIASLKTAANGQELLNRINDIKFVLDEIARRNDDEGVLQRKCDLDRIAISGHSFGAGTSMAMAGQTYGGGARVLSAADPRIKCAIYLSAPANLHGRTAQAVFGSIKIPGLLMTGTEDDSPINDTRAADRRIPYDGMTAPHQYLVIFNGGDHMIFNGATRRAQRPGDAQMISEIEKVTTAFLDAYLRGDKQQQAWLDKDARAYLTDAKFEHK